MDNISGCDGPTERISSFVDHLLQPIAMRQKSYIKDTTDFIHVVEETIIPQDTILVSMDRCYKLVHEHPTRGGNSNSMQCI